MTYDFPVSEVVNLLTNYTCAAQVHIKLHFVHNNVSKIASYTILKTIIHRLTNTKVTIY